jgi:hypothetical protein
MQNTAAYFAEDRGDIPEIEWRNADDAASM